MSHEIEVLLLLGAWGGYFAVHSLLASGRVKQAVAVRYPRLRIYYRLLFNIASLLLLLPILLLIWQWRGDLLWHWVGPWRWVADGLALLAAFAFLWTFRYYSGREFLGLRQIAEGDRTLSDREHLSLSPLHRHVRHPWYSLGLVILWTREMDVLLLASTIAITLYLVIGSRLEERKLVGLHGSAYERYRQRVPGLIPLPGRSLGREEAEQLLALTVQRDAAK